MPSGRGTTSGREMCDLLTGMSEQENTRGSVPVEVAYQKATDLACLNDFVCGVHSGKINLCRMTVDPKLVHTTM